MSAAVDRVSLPGASAEPGRTSRASDLPQAGFRAWQWLAAFGLAVCVALACTELTRLALERAYVKGLGGEVQRRVREIEAVTMNGKVMGAVATLGLVNPDLKAVAHGQMPLASPSILQTLGAVGSAYRANGVYLATADGVVQSCWYTMGVTLTGVDIGFRPYFQIAMQGKQNVYAAIGTTTGQRSLYFAAPLYGEASDHAPIIGAAVARLGLESVDAILQAWTAGPVLLLSPQAVTFASNRPDWIERLAVPATPTTLASIRKLKQFGLKYEQGAPGQLPVDLAQPEVLLDGRRYAVARAPVQWNDPNGDWSMVLLGRLDEVMPLQRRAWIGLGSGLATWLLCGLFLVWRQRLRQARARQRRAEAALKAHAATLEAESARKSYLNEMSNELHSTDSLAMFARCVMAKTVARVGADQAVLYAYDRSEQKLLAVGAHAVALAALPALAIGQGLIGQCAKDQRAIEVSGGDGGELRVRWSQGEQAPHTVLYLPLHQAEELQGVLVLAALKPLQPEQRELLDAILPMVSMNLDILQRNLGRSEQAAQLRQQQARLRELEALHQGTLAGNPDAVPLTSPGAPLC